MDAIPTRRTRLAGVERQQQDLSRLLALLAEVVEGHKLTNRDDAALVQLPADAMKAVRQEVADAVTRCPSCDELGYAGFTCPLCAQDALDEAADRAEGMRNR